MVYSGGHQILSWGQKMNCPICKKEMEVRDTFIDPLDFDLDCDATVFDCNHCNKLILIINQ